MTTLTSFIISTTWGIILGVLSGLISAFFFDKWRRRDAVDDLRFAALEEMIDKLVYIGLDAEKWKGSWKDNPQHSKIRSYGKAAYRLGGYPAMQLLVEAVEARSQSRSLGGRINKIWSGIGFNDRRGVWIA